MNLNFNAEIQAALRHVNDIFPDVTQVFFGVDGRWMFCGEAFYLPNFDEASGPIDISLLEEAVDAAAEECGLPCAAGLITLEKLYHLWDKLGEVSLMADLDSIAEPFLHFAKGTSRTEIWQQFEKLHPEFVVGEVMEGIRKS